LWTRTRTQPDHLLHPTPAGTAVEAYLEQQLRDLLERVREGFARLDSGEIGVRELDDLIRRYARAAQELRDFCGSSEEDLETTARVLGFLREQGGQPDWWSGRDAD
jgi:hypothetical protein